MPSSIVFSKFFFYFSKDSNCFHYLIDEGSKLKVSKALTLSVFDDSSKSSNVSNFDKFCTSTKSKNFALRWWSPALILNGYSNKQQLTNTDNSFHRKTYRHYWNVRSTSFTINPISPQQFYTMQCNQIINMYQNECKVSISRVKSQYKE